MAAKGADYSSQLRQLMQQVGIGSYRALGEQAELSQWGIRLLRLGQVERLRIGMLLRLSAVLKTSVADLITIFSGSTDALDPPVESSPGGHDAPSVATLQREYSRLQHQMAEQEQEIRRQVQGEAISVLESWLLQWPTAAYAVQQNGNLPASRLLPLTKPLDALLNSWDLTTIGTVGEVVPFEPQLHQPMGGHARPGQSVKIRYVGYRHGNRLLYRAKVSPVDSSSP